MHKLKQPLGGVPGKKVLLKYENMNGDGLYIDDQVRISGFVLFHIQGSGIQVLLNPWETFVKELSF